MAVRAITAGLAFLLAWQSLKAGPAEAQGAFTLFGNARSVFRYQEVRTGGQRERDSDLTQEYTLGTQGNIIDPRLATFNGTATYLSNDAFTKNTEERQLLSLTSSLSLFPASPYSLVLRYAQSHTEGRLAASDSRAMGANWRLAFEDLPALFLSFDRVEVESRGPSPSEAVFTLGNLRLLKRFVSSEFEAELGYQKQEEQILRTSRENYFARLRDVITWSPATTLRILGRYDQFQNSRLGSGAFSLVNRPDPSLTRTLDFSAERSELGDQRLTTVDGSGSVFKSFQTFPTLTTRLSGTMSGRRSFAEGLDVKGTTSAAGTVGGGLVSTYLSFLSIALDATGAAAYNAEDKGSEEIGKAEQVHGNLTTRSLDPYRVAADYTLSVEQRTIERTQQVGTVSLEGAPMGGLFFRSSGEYRDDRSKGTIPSPFSTRQRSLTGAGSASYTGFANLSLTVNGAVQRVETTEVPETFITRVGAGLRYVPGVRAVLSIDAVRETDSAIDQTRYQAKALFSYRIGKLTFSTEYQFEDRQTRGGVSTQRHTALVTVSRSFVIFGPGASIFDVLGIPRWLADAILPQREESPPTVAQAGWSGEPGKQANAGHADGSP